MRIIIVIENTVHYRWISHAWNWFNFYNIKHPFGAIGENFIMNLYLHAFRFKNMNPYTYGAIATDWQWMFNAVTSRETFKPFCETIYTTELWIRCSTLWSIENHQFFGNHYSQTLFLNALIALWFFGILDY